MTNSKHLLALAAIEGLIMLSAVGRIAIPGQLNLSVTGHLVWLVATMFIAGGALTHFVLRNARLNAQKEPGPSVEEDRKQIFVVSLAILAGAGLLSLAGPHSVERLLP